MRMSESKERERKKRKTGRDSERQEGGASKVGERVSERDDNR